MAIDHAPPADLADTARINLADVRYQKLLRLRAARQALERAQRELSGLEADIAAEAGELPTPEAPAR